MDFKALRRKIGFGLAVVISQRNLDSKFFENMNVFEWLEVYCNALPGSELKNNARNNILKMTVDFDTSLIVYHKLSPESALQKVILDKMLEQAASVNQLLIVYQSASPRSSSKRIALSRVSELVSG